MKDNYRLSAELIAQIEEAIRKEERVEIVPTKTGPRLFACRRKELKPGIKPGVGY